MINAARLQPALAYLLLLWEESGENLAIFCYLIILTAWARAELFCSATLAAILTSARLKTACWTRSCTFFVRSTAPKASVSCSAGAERRWSASSFSWKLGCL